MQANIMKSPIVRRAVDTFLASRARESAFLRAEFARAVPQASDYALNRALASLVWDGVLAGWGMWPMPERSRAAGREILSWQRGLMRLLKRSF